MNISTRCPVTTHWVCFYLFPVMWQTATMKFIAKVFIFWLKILWPVCFQSRSMVQILRMWPLLKSFISWSTVFITFYLKLFLTWFTWSKLAGKICGLAGLWRPHLCYSCYKVSNMWYPSYPHHLNSSCYIEDKILELLGSKAWQPSFCTDYYSEYSLFVQSA